jgi:molybdate transport system substrate-binding protein
VGSSELYFLGLLDRLGIAAEMKPKIRPMGVGQNPAEAVARGEAEMAVVGAALIPMAPGAETVGWLPAELQSYVVFTGGVSAAAREPEAGKALLRFLTAPAAMAVFKANGLEPVAP